MTARALRVASSLRTSVVLMIAISVYLLAGVAIPQRSVVGARAIDSASSGSPFAAFVFDTLHLSDFAESPIFLVLLGLFAANLLVVLASRAGAVVRRINSRTPSTEALTKWTSSPSAVIAPLPDGWSAGVAARTLRVFGYRVKYDGVRAFWGVKHRTGPIGFLVFHASFLLLAVAGLQVWATRFVAPVRLTEGETFDGSWTNVIRHAPAGDPAPFRFAATSIDPVFVNGEAAELRAALRLDSGVQATSVNHPARWGSASIVISDVGIAPVLWLQDRDGFTLDRVAVAAEHGRPTDVKTSRFDIQIAPRVTPQTFPSREALRSVETYIVVRDATGVRFRGSLRPGQVATFDGGSLVIPEIRYWAGLRIVSERGGALLIAGFLLAVVGLVWRMAAHRREIALTWDEASYRVAGSGEFFPLKFRDELNAISTALGRSSS